MNDLSGFLNVLKPPEITSHGVVAFVRRLLGKKLKVGHLGTLDPLAVGVLPLALGRATRLIQYFPPARKVYVGEVTLGLSSDTLDLGGNVRALGPIPEVATEQLEEACSRFKGTIMQVPPRVSALRVDGRRGYERARRGEQFELEPRPAQYHQVTLLDRDGSRFRLMVDCGPGTYVRALARDLGQLLGVPALLSFLARLRSGPFHLEEAFTLEELLRARGQGLESCLVPCGRALSSIPETEVPELPGKGGTACGRSRFPLELDMVVRLMARGGEQAVGRVEQTEPLKLKMLCPIPGVPGGGS